MMKPRNYFNQSHYTGYHYHVECWEPTYKCFVEAIVEERKDGSYDVFFDQFTNENEYMGIFSGTQHYDDPTGVFLFNVINGSDVTIKFKNWVEQVLSAYRIKVNP
jgi:hypothetical protein